MNKIIITARMAKGLTEKEVAHKLKIDESSYKEIELGISPTTSEIAENVRNFNPQLLIFKIFQFLLIPIYQLRK